LEPNNISEGILEITDLLFTSENWSDTVIVFVNGVDDDEVDGDISYQIEIFPAESDDSKYNNINLDDISLINVDNDSKTLIIPEAFSPGNDTYNDYFIIVNLQHYDNATIRIYNRWGNLVYSNNDYENDWDGKSNVGSSLGSELPMGTYFYVLEIEEKEEKISGSIFIKR
jgi:gliding motility-associated-like protein